MSATAHSEHLNQHWAKLYSGLTETSARFGLDWPEFFGNLPASQQAALRKVLSVSNYVADNLPKDASWITAAISSNRISQPIQQAQISQWITDVTASFGATCTEEQWSKALRIVRRRAMLHIIWCDVLRLADTLTTTRSVSALADEVVCRSIRFLSPFLQARHGAPIGRSSGVEQPMLVLGMGKLGGYELNLSSDIDLIFTYPESGDTSGPKVITNQEYFIKLGQKLITALDKHTIDGFVFRTDMRLRPYGQSGPLVMNFDAMEEYYQDQGRDWERYAMVKARVMTGEECSYARELLNILRPFTYRVYIDYSAFESLRSMKAMINAEVRRRGLDMDVKLGPGGIREIEFTVQAFQLIRGGQDKQLQQRELIPVLATLAADGYLPEEAAQELHHAYRFLRDSEHAIQALNDEQTQQLPHDTTEQARMALAMGCDDWPHYLTRLQQHRSAVRYHFAEIVRSEQEDQETSPQQHTWIDLWHGDLSADTRQQLDELSPVMLDAGFQQLLDKFRNSRAVSSMQAIGRERLEALMPMLLQILSQYPQPHTTLERLLPLLEAVLRRTAYLILLKENPQALQQLIRLCSASPWVAAYISQTPLLLDELLNSHNLLRRPQHKELREELYLRLLRIAEDDLEQQMEQLRQFVRAHKLHAAACEVTGTLPLMQISDYLTFLAEVTLEAVLQLSWQQMISKYGHPVSANGEIETSPNLIIIGYGKVGGVEMSYSSDLDLVFLHNSYAMGSTHADNSAGQRSIDNNVFYTRLGQRMIHILTTQTRSGDIYEVDMRLRPSGNSGMIVATVRAFEEYQKNHAWTWEHQALVRARVLCGDPAVAAEFQRIRQQTLTSLRDPSDLATEVNSMRQKMREQLGSSSGSSATASTQKFHLKQDAGGIVDIEFLVQYGVLAWSHQFPELLAVTDNMRLLDTFETVGLLDSQDRQTLQETYLSYRAETHRRALQNQNLILEAEESQLLGFDACREDVTRLWKLWLER
jgi:[glutamine synthetase] adenylyltransferase / [glutamine synthetase]-adenylyl-L-tyrosine phosphorylase